MTPGTGALGPGFAFALGTATFLAPCAFPLLPGYLAYFLGTDDGLDRSRGARLRRAVVVGAATSAGLLAVYAALAAVALALGTRLLRDVAVLEPVVGLLLVGLGAGMATGRLHLAPTVALPARRRSVAGYLLFGAVYAAAAAGCSAPVFVAVVSVALTGGPAAGAVTLGAYAAGTASLLVAVTLAAALGREALLARLAARTGLVTRLAGVALAGSGLVQIGYYLLVLDGLARLAP